jgi:multidrug efflux pump subunit AcrA (membrane-fusion protein)
MYPQDQHHIERLALAQAAYERMSNLATASLMAFTDQQERRLRAEAEIETLKAQAAELQTQLAEVEQIASEQGDNLNRCAEFEGHINRVLSDLRQDNANLNTRLAEVTAQYAEALTLTAHLYQRIAALQEQLANQQRRDSTQPPTPTPEPAPQEWELPWSRIPARFQFVAADSDGAVFAYVNRPTPTTKTDEGDWFGAPTHNGESSYMRLRDIDLPEWLDWRESLRERPARLWLSQIF